MKTFLAILVIVCSLVITKVEAQTFYPFSSGVAEGNITFTPDTSAAGLSNSIISVAGTNRIQILSPVGGNNGYTDGDTIKPTAPFTVGISFYGNGVPFIHFSASTNVGDWHHRAIFSDGIEQIGGPDYMDTNSSTVFWYVNGSSNFGWKASGDAFPTSINMSTNRGSSGSGWSIATVSSSNGQIPSVLGPSDATFLLVKTNANPVIMPGWAQMVFNSITPNGLTNHVRGLAISSPTITPGGYAGGNYNLGMFDFINKTFHVPFWITGVFQPQDDPVNWRDTFKVDPFQGRVGVGRLPTANTPSATFQVADSTVEFLLGGASSYGALYIDEYHIFDKTVANAELFSMSPALKHGRFNGIGWTNNGHLTVSSNLFVAAGAGGSNVTVGGVLYKTVTVPAATNLNATIATFSNALQYIVPGHTMTNNGDSITVIYQGTMKPGTNAFKWFVGYETPFSFTCTNGFTAWELKGEITRTANVGAQLQASFTFMQTNGTTPFALSGLLTNMTLSYTNGVNVTNVLQLASSQVGSISNNYMKVLWEPMSR